MAPAIESDSRKAQSSSPVALHADSGSPHHETGVEPLALAPRIGQPVEAPPLAVDATADEALDVLASVSGPAHPRTARDARNPGAGLAPTASTLQTFRC
ncbi:hypothetical protein ACIRBZ_19140 [Streptomyces sp. NPDC094038]|uniref:hypothetical protein n=1 Tax=Streptomyces sp. NPDC094038 TaxID=3366055 RepID=UPI00381AE44C